MKKALKVTFGTMLAVGMVSTVYAHDGHHHHHHHGHHAHNAWDQTSISVTGTWTESTSNGLSTGDLIVAQNLPGAVGPTDGSRRSLFLDMENEFDYGLGLTYHIPGTHTRLFIAYDHFADEKENTTAGPVTDIGEVAAITNTGFAHVEHEADEFRLGISYLHGIGSRVHMNYSAYLEFDDLERELFERVNVVGNPIPSSRSTSNEVEGWGPGVGIMVRGVPCMDYPHWGMFAGLKTALLFVDNEYSQSAYDENGQLMYERTAENSESVVNKLDISFGIDYCRVIHTDMSKLMFDVALGMKYMNLVNVFKNGNAAPSLFGSANGFAQSNGNPNDWGRVGPFLTFRIGGHDA